MLVEKLGSPAGEVNNSSMDSTRRDEHAEEWKVRGDSTGGNASIGNLRSPSGVSAYALCIAAEEQGWGATKVTFCLEKQ